MKQNGVIKFIVAVFAFAWKVYKSKAFSYLTKALFYVYLATTTLSSCRSVLHATNLDYDGSFGKPTTTDYIPKSLNQVGYNSPIYMSDTTHIK
jgi:hypothetical protein